MVINSEFVFLCVADHKVCFSCQPCHIKDWEMLLHFKVHGQGDTLFGDGFALWYTKDRMQEGTLYSFSFPELPSCPS